MNKTLNIILVVIALILVGIILIKLITKPDLPVYEQIDVIGEQAPVGMADPSVEYKDGIGYLVYTSLYPPFMHNSLAKSVDGGKTWTFVEHFNEGKEAVFDLDGKKIPGMWRNEVASLAYDFGDEKWKLVAHKYFIKKPYYDYAGLKLYDDMYISYREANSPEELDDAEEVNLFGASKAQTAAKYILNDLNESLKDVTGYSEPGLFYKNGVLYMSLSSFHMNKDLKHLYKRDTVFLLASYNHGDSWEFVNTLIDYKSSRALGYNTMTGTSIAEQDGRVFLLVAPITNKHAGTLIIEFEDLKTGKLKKDSSGKLLVHKYLKPSLKNYYNAGQADYHEENTYGGVVMAQHHNLNLKKDSDPFTTETFFIWSTGEGLV